MQHPTTVRELVDRFLEWADKWYQSPEDQYGVRTPTTEPENLRCHLRPLLMVAGEKNPADLRAEDLHAVQQHMLTTRKPDGSAYSRSYINKCTKSIRRCIKWATKPPQRWVAITVLEDLKLCDPLVYGRSDAAETAEVRPVSREHWMETLTACAMLQQQIRPPRGFRPATKWHRYNWPHQLAQAIELLWWSGMRPGEMLAMNVNRTSANGVKEIRIEKPNLSLHEMEAEIMVYSPWAWKGRHRGYDRNIFLGPESQRIVTDLMPFASPDGRLFSWTVSGLSQALRRANRMLISGEVRDMETTAGRAGAKIMQASPGFRHWFCYQLRHAAATRWRQQSGIDVAQRLLGHRHRTTTEIYAEPDCAAAISALRRYG